MDLKEIIIDSIRYAGSDWIKVFLLGLVIFIADISNEIFGLGSVADEIDFILIMAGLILLTLESGYIFRILEESIGGSKTLPHFHNPAELFIHGIKELTVIIIYFTVPFLMVVLALGGFDKILGTLDQELAILLLISGIILGSILYLIYQLALLNMAYHGGSIRSAFYFREIFQKLRKIGLKDLLMVYILTAILLLLVESNLSDALSLLPYNLGEAISSLLVAPFLLICIVRILGLIDKPL